MSVNDNPAASNSSQPAGGADANRTGRVPSFDIVRVEPSGDSVIAARGLPDADIALLDGSKTIAHAKADANGQVALLPPPLTPGDHSLALTMTLPGGSSAVSSQSVVVSVPSQPRTAPMVALIQPNQPAAILSGPVAGGATANPPTAAPSIPGVGKSPGEPVAIRSVEMESKGSFFASGRALPGSKSRVYLNGAYVATVTSDPSGIWSLRINRGMKAGHYEVRADQIQPDGKVVARVQVPFDYPGDDVATSARQDPAKKNITVADGGPSAAAPGGDLPHAGLTATVPPARSVGIGTAAGASTVSGAAPTASDQANSHDQTSTSVSAAPAAGNRLSPASTPVQPAPIARETVQTVPPPKPIKASPNPAPSTDAPVASPSEPPAAHAPAVAASVASSTGVQPPSSTQPPTPPSAALSADAKAPFVAAQSADPAATAASNGTATPVSQPDKLVEADGSKTGMPADQMTADGGADAPKRSPSGSPAPPTSAADSPVNDAEGTMPTVLAELVTARVIRGDSLWRISREMLGHGVRYTQIYAANTQQIRNPRMIFPGQVFVLPTE